MAQDVMKKAKEAAPFRNGSIVLGCDKMGNKTVITPTINAFRDDTGAYNVLNDRFKDYNYYSN